MERGFDIMKILLLEDDIELCSSIQDELQKAGYIVDCCYDGETAMIHALNIEYCYDLAVIDRMLPIIDGMTKLATPISNGGLVLTPPGYSTGSA